ncbi:MAG TPA: GlsB/YeaQ/YmgE family stress response membrane protein [Gemmatimonadaceae bacterium]|jgi:uncharacterized membrane protein YeaQ/YmgE (transglycosylase-associated protein family)
MALWLYWILFGLVVGSLAKFLMPGRDPAGCIFTVVLGVIGAFVGGLVGSAFGFGGIAEGRFDLRSIALATIGAMLLLLIGRLARKL